MKFFHINCFFVFSELIKIYYSYNHKEGFMKFILILFSFSFLNPVLAGPMHNAAIDGDLATMKHLLQKGADVNKKDYSNYTPLHHASYYERPLIVEFLLANGAAVDPKQVGRTPLHYACKEGSVKVVPILIRNKANVNAKDILGNTPLHYAIIQGYLEIVTMLVENGSDVNARTKQKLFGWIEGHTPLGLAMDYSGSEDIVKYLKNKGAVE